MAPQLARWAYEAGSPLDEWRFGDESRALDLLTTWIFRSSSEVAYGRWQVAFDGDAPKGAYVAMPEPDLVAARRADLLALVTLADGVADLRERLAEIRDLFIPVEAADFYLSRIVVESDARGRGLGAQLLAAVIATAICIGATAVRADVSAGNEAAIALYRSLGFNIAPERISKRAGISYRAVKLAI
ncbi:MAG: GNAT family N-acetyltransferase [Gaiellaceae bacterium]